MGTPKKIIKMECDEPMARHKHLLPCKGHCKQCVACIMVADTGEREHREIQWNGRRKV